MSQTDYEQAPHSLVVRELYTGGKLLVTTLICPKATTKAALKELYRDRWHVELDLRNIKTTLGMETLSCRTPAMVEKELWVYLLAYNLIRLLMAQSAFLVDMLPRQLSFKHTVQTWIAWRQSTVNGYLITSKAQLLSHWVIDNEPAGKTRRYRWPEIRFNFRKVSA
jgi:hypothetical protein